MRWVLLVVVLIACGGVEDELESASRAADAPDWCVEECRFAEDAKPLCCNKEWEYDTCACACYPHDCGGKP